MSTLPAREAYRRWAPTYESENPITQLEQLVVERLGPSPRGRTLLDAGCGTGRRLIACGAAHAVGVDHSPEMLAVGRSNSRLSGPCLVEGDLCALPFPAAGFDLIWCRLAIGHVADAGRAYAELARVASPRAAVIVTDFHEAAHAAGHRRSFRTPEGVYEVEHHARTAAAHQSAAAHAGLTCAALEEATIGETVRHFYVSAGREQMFAAHRGLPVVLGMRFVRDG